MIHQPIGINPFLLDGFILLYTLLRVKNYYRGKNKNIFTRFNLCAPDAFIKHSVPIRFCQFLPSTLAGSQ